MSRYPRFTFKVHPETGEVILPRWSSKLNEKGEEILDPTPVAIPVGFERPPTLEAQIERIMALSHRRAALEGRELDDDDFEDDGFRLTDADGDIEETVHQRFYTKAEKAEMDAFIDDDVSKKLSKRKKAPVDEPEARTGPQEPEAGADGSDPQ